MFCEFCLYDAHLKFYTLLFNLLLSIWSTHGKLFGFGIYIIATKLCILNIFIFPSSSERHTHKYFIYLFLSTCFNVFPVFFLITIPSYVMIYFESPILDPSHYPMSSTCSSLGTITSSGYSIENYILIAEAGFCMLVIF